MSQAIIALVLLSLSLPMFAACDPTLNLAVDRPFTSESDPTVVAAKATSGCPITALSVWVDYKLIYQQRGFNTLDARLVMGNGPHRVGIVAENSAGTVVKEVRYILTNADPVEPPAGCDVFQSGVQFTGDHIPYPTTSPVRVGMVAKSDSGQISSIRLYIDGINRAQVWGTSGYCLPVAMLPLKSGLHFVNVEAWDNIGNILLSGSIMQVVP
jgi:hypothetical protein